MNFFTLYHYHTQNLASKLENIVLRNEDYYQQAQIELKLQTKCQRLDTDTQMVYLNDGTAIHYDKCFIATGSRLISFLCFSVLIKLKFYFCLQLDHENIIHQC